MGKPNDKSQKLMDELTKLGDPGPQSTPQQHARRAEILEELAGDAEGDMRTQWYRQLADTLSAAVQGGSWPAGVEQFKALEEKLKADPKDDELAYYVVWRRMTAEHGQELSTAKPDDFAKIQTQWVEDLEKFLEEAKKYPDSADAMQELAISQEFAGEEDKALKWYDAIVKDFPDAPIHRKAKGAKLRLTSVGKPIALQGKLVTGGAFDLAKLKDKVVLVQYWATWCEPAKSDMPLLKNLRAKFKGAFEVVGVCLDNDKAEMMAFLQEERPPLAATVRRRRSRKPLRHRDGNSNAADHDPDRQAGPRRRPEHPGPSARR